MIATLSIRWRLTLWYAVALALILAAFGTAIYWATARQLMERVDAGLEEELADVVGEVQRSQDRAGMLGWLERRFAHHEGFDFQINDAAGHRVFANVRLATRHLPSVDTPVNRLSHATFTLDDVGRYRIVTQKVDGPEGPLTVQVARSLASYDHELTEMSATLLVLGPLALLATVGSGYFLARRALAPVDRMTATANRIDARRLGERLEGAQNQDELGRLASTLNGTLDRLQNSFQEMQRFTADASHELRTPLSIIQTEAELAISKPLGDAEKQDLLGSILEECRRLSWITDQLLTLCREDTGLAPSVRVAVDVASVALQVADSMRPLADLKEQSLLCSPTGRVVVMGDPVRIRHVLYNLVENALKYTPSGGRIVMTIETERDVCRLVVTDDGIGISAEHLPHIFERFYRVDKARSSSEGGSGLGLSIVQSIVAAHDGKIDVVSAPGRGTTFKIELPRERTS